MYLESAAIAIERVAFRVKKGGHHIPPDVIKRRYHKGLENFMKYAGVVNEWYLMNNSGEAYEMIAKWVEDHKEINNFELYKTISKDEDNR